MYQYRIQIFIVVGQFTVGRFECWELWKGGRLYFWEIFLRPERIDTCAMMRDIVRGNNVSHADNLDIF